MQNDIIFYLSQGNMIGSGGFMNLLKSQERFKKAKSNENMMRTHLEESSEENLNDTEEEDEVGVEEETTSDGDSEMDEMDGRLVQYEEFQEEQGIEKKTTMGHSGSYISNLDPQCNHLFLEPSGYVFSN